MDPDRGIKEGSELKVGVVGAGVMGSDIAVLLANAGYRVTLVDVKKQALKEAMDSLDDSVSQLREAEILMNGDPSSNINYTSSHKFLNKSELVIEAITEKLDLKRKLMVRLEEIVSNDCVIATNTSSYTVSEITERMDQPERTVLMHFSNPPILRDFVEIAKGEKTLSETFDFALETADKIRKPPIVPKKECRGYILNRLLGAGMVSSAYEYAEGGKPEEIDATFKELGSPLGIFEMMDMIGIDVALYVQENFEEVYGERFELPELFKEKVESMIKEEKLGKKTGEGFYKWKCREATIPETSSEYDITGIIASVINEAFREKEDGISDKETINRTYKLAAGAPVGIFELGDLISFKELKSELEELYEKRRTVYSNPLNNFYGRLIDFLAEKFNSIE